MILENIKDQIKTAMKARDSLRLSTLKMLSSELHNAAIDNHGELDNKQEIAVVRKEAKKRKDAIDAYIKAGAIEKAEKERAELEILNEFLPSEISDEKLQKIVDAAIAETGAKTMADMGKTIANVKLKTGESADGAKIAQMVKIRLTS